jgi:hypothetical protein
MTFGPTIKDFVPSLAAAVAGGGTDALRRFLAGADLPLLGDREPAEILQDAIRSAADRPQLSKSVAEMLARLVAEERVALSSARSPTDPGRLQLLSSALRLAAELPTSPHLFGELKLLLEALETSSDKACHPLYPDLWHALIYQQTDNSLESKWFANLMAVRSLQSGDRSTHPSLLEAWRGLLWIPPLRPNGGVVDISRLDRGLQALERASVKEEHRSALLVQAFEILSDTFPRSIGFWRSRLLGRVLAWPKDLLDAALEVWPGLRPLPEVIILDGVSRGSPEASSLEAILSAQPSEYLKPLITAEIKSFLLSSGAECLEMSQPARFSGGKSLLVMSSLLHQLKQDPRLAECYWAAGPRPHKAFLRDIPVCRVESIADDQGQADLLKPRRMMFFDSFDPDLIYRTKDGSRFVSLVKSLATEDARRADLLPLDQEMFVSSASTHLPESGVHIQLLFSALRPKTYLAALDRLQRDARKAALVQLHWARLSAWHPMERRFLRAFLAICALRDGDFELALSEIGEPTFAGATPLEHTIISLHAHAGAGQLGKSRAILDYLKHDLDHIPTPAKEAFELIDSAYGLSAPASKRAEDFQHEIIQREIQVLEAETAAAA